MKMTDLGWSSFFDSYFEEYKEQGYSVMRITRENREHYIAISDRGEFSCEVTGKFRFENKSKSQFPTVGDWVVVSIVPNEEKALIHAVLPRKSKFSRKVTGETTEEQAVAANINTIFIVTGLDLNYNLRRIERYLAIAWESGAVPVIILNKSDVCPEFDLRKTEVESVAIGVDVIVVSAFNKDNLVELEKYIKSGETIAFIGSSGVGKSTIINALSGTNQLRVNEVSELGSRGRHTTTFRELIILTNGGMVIDTPGMREIQVWGDEDGVERVFNDVAEIAEKCRFKDCSHENEPGCAVQEAINNGNLDKKRFENYLKLKKEFAYLADRQTMKASAIEKEHWKDISKFAKKLKKGRW